MKPLPVQLAAQLPRSGAQAHWLIEELWMDQAVGILGGEPKSYKSYLALDIAVSVASGRPCLRHYPVCQPGPVLLFPAEDSLNVVRQRLEGICAAADTPLETLPLQVITAPSLRLDWARDRQRLALTLQILKPRLLILDPLIRLHQVEENEASQIAPLLSGLRQLQRRFQLAVLVVHHTKKQAHCLRPGQALRGSSELHGWGDSNLYLRRKADQLLLYTEHRAAASQEDIPLRLTASGSALALRMISPEASTPPPAKPSAQQRVWEALAGLDRPVSLKQLRKLCGMRTTTLCHCLAQMSQQGLVNRDVLGYRLKTPEDSQAVSQLPLSIESQGNGNGKHPQDD